MRVKFNTSTCAMYHTALERSEVVSLVKLNPSKSSHRSLIPRLTLFAGNSIVIERDFRSFSCSEAKCGAFNTICRQGSHECVLTMAGKVKGGVKV